MPGMSRLRRMMLTFYIPLIVIGLWVFERDTALGASTLRPEKEYAEHDAHLDDILHVSAKTISSKHRSLIGRTPLDIDPSKSSDTTVFRNTKFGQSFDNQALLPNQRLSSFGVPVISFEKMPKVQSPIGITNTGVAQSPSNISPLGVPNSLSSSSNKIYPQNGLSYIINNDEKRNLNLLAPVQYAQLQHEDDSPVISQPKTVKQIDEPSKLVNLKSRSDKFPSNTNEGPKVINELNVNMTNKESQLVNELNHSNKITNEETHPVKIQNVASRPVKVSSQVHEMHSAANKVGQNIIMHDSKGEQPKATNLKIRIPQRLPEKVVPRPQINAVPQLAQENLRDANTKQKITPPSLVRDHDQEKIKHLVNDLSMILSALNKTANEPLNQRTRDQQQKVVGNFVSAIDSVIESNKAHHQNSYGNMPKINCDCSPIGPDPSYEYATVSIYTLPNSNILYID